MPLQSVFLNSGKVPLLLSGLLLVLLGIHFSHFVRAMRPKRGTLEWIALVDRPAASFAAEQTPLCLQEFLLLAAVALAAVAVRGLPVLPMLLHMPDVRLNTIVTLALTCILSPAALASAGYLLMRRLFGGRFLPVLSALLLTLNYNTSPVYAPFALIAAVLTVEYLSKGRLWAAFAAAAVLAVGMYAEPALLWFAGVLYVPVVFAAIVEYKKRSREHRGLRLCAALFGYPLILPTVTVLTILPGALASGMTLPQELFSPAFAIYLGLRTMSMLGAATPVISDILLTPSDLLLLVYALGALLVLLPQAFRRRDLRIWLAVWLFAANCALCAFQLSSPVLGVMPLLGCLWSRWNTRGGRIHSCIAAATLLLSSALDFFMLMGAIR